MFLLLPVWKKDADRLPLVTLLLIMTNTLIFLGVYPWHGKFASTVTTDELVRQGDKLSRVALRGKDQLPAALVTQLESLQTQSLSPETIHSIFEQVENNKSKLSNALQYDWDTQYPVFRGVVEQWKTAPEASTAYSKYGLIGGGDYFPRIITHQFLHQGWMHLLGNMLFLFVAGLVLEEMIGSFFLIVVYLAGGVAAALAQIHWAGVPNGEIMVGASGAISALIGFVLAYVPSVHITMFYFAVLTLSPKYGTMHMPGWVVIPLWIGAQALFAHVLANSTTNNVAFMAHLGGCAFGFGAGLLFRFMTPPPREN